MTHHEVSFAQDLGNVSTCFYMLHDFCYLAPLKHCTEAIQLLEELCKVLKQLPCTFSSHRTWLLVRRLRLEFKGAL